VVVFGCDWLCQQIEQIEGVLLERKPTEAERQPDQRKQPFLMELDPAGATIRRLACPQERTSPDPNAPGRLGFGWAPLSW